MTSVSARRATNLGAWLAGAVLAQGLALAALSFSRPDPAYGIAGTLFFAALFGLAGVFCALIGYALIAPFWPSTATAGTSFIIGGICSLLVLAVTIVSGLILRSDSARLLGATITCVALGACSYAVANRARSNNRWRGP
jgi:hypothetical protein